MRAFRNQYAQERTSLRGFWSMKGQKEMQGIKEIAQVVQSIMKPSTHWGFAREGIFSLRTSNASRSGAGSMVSFVWFIAPRSGRGIWPIGTWMRSWLPWCGEVQQSLSWYVRYRNLGFRELRGWTRRPQPGPGRPSSGTGQMRSDSEVLV